MYLAAIVGCSPSHHGPQVEAPQNPQQDCAAGDASGADEEVDARRVALEFLEHAGRVIARQDYPADEREDDAYLIIEQRLRAGDAPNDDELARLLSAWFPKVPQHVRPWRLGDAYLRILLSRCDRDSGSNWYLEALNAARHRALRSKSGIDLYVDLAWLLAEGGEYLAAERVLCEALGRAQRESRPQRRQADSKRVFYNALSLWSRGAHDRFLNLAVEAARDLPPPEKAKEKSQTGFSFCAEVPRAILDQVFSPRQPLEELAARAARRFNTLRSRGPEESIATIARPPAEFENAGDPTGGQSLDPLRRSANALRLAADLAHDLEWQAVLRALEAIALLAGGDLDASVAVLERLPSYEGSSPLDWTRAAAATQLAMAAGPANRRDLLLAAERAAEPIRDPHFAACIYRDLAIAAFCLGDRERGEQYIERGLNASDALGTRDLQPFNLLGGYLQAFHLSRLGIVLLAVGDQEGGLALLKRAADTSQSPDLLVLSDLALLAEKRKALGLLEAASRLLRPKFLASRASYDLYFATLQARLGARQQALQTLLASARGLDGQVADSAVEAACLYAQGLAELGDQQAAQELFSKVLQGDIQDKAFKIEGLGFSPVEYVALTWAHQAAVTHNKELLRRAVTLVSGEPYDRTRYYSGWARVDLVHYMTYLAERTRDKQLLRDALRLAWSAEDIIDDEGEERRVEHRARAVRSIGESAARLMDTQLVKELATWARTQESTTEFSMYCALARGLLSSARPPVLAAWPFPAPERVDDFYPERGSKFRWQRLADLASRRVILADDQHLAHLLASKPTESS